MISLLPNPERDWNATWKKKLPAILALRAARTATRWHHTVKPALTPRRLIAFGNLGDQFQMLSVLSRLPSYARWKVVSNAEAAPAGPLYEELLAESEFKYHGVAALGPSLLGRSSGVEHAAVGLVPHPFVTQPLAIAYGNRICNSVIGAKTGEYPCSADSATFLQCDRSSWRRFYESFFELALGERPATTRPRIRQRYRHIGSNTIVLHLSASVTQRAIPLEVARELVEALADTGVECVLVGSEIERQRLSTISSRAKVVAGRPLEEIATLLAGCAAFVGVDSSIMHLADAIGTPCVVIYSATSSSLVGPFYAPYRSIEVAGDLLSEVTVLTGRRQVASPSWINLGSRVSLGVADLRKHMPS